MFLFLLFPVVLFFAFFKRLNFRMKRFRWIRSLRSFRSKVSKCTISSVQFSHSVLSDSLRPHGLQHARPPCPSPTPGVHPNPCPLSQWCHPTILSCCPLLLLPSIFPSIRVFSNELALHIRWPKYWSFQLQHQSFQWIPRTDLL